MPRTKWRGLIFYSHTDAVRYFNNPLNRPAREAEFEFSRWRDAVEWFIDAADSHPASDVIIQQVSLNQGVVKNRWLWYTHYEVDDER